MKHREYKNSIIDMCNGKYINKFIRDKFQCTNGNRFRKCEVKIDKTNEEDIKTLSHTKCNRSQRCLEHKSIVQSSRKNNTLFYSKFAFHRLINLMIVLLFIACTIVNGQQQLEFRQKTRNTDIFSAHKTHAVIQPIIFDGTNQREILSTTRQTNGEHAPHVVLEYTHLDRAIAVDLFLTRHLLTDRHFLQSQNANGSKNIQTFNRTNSNLCHYQGRIRHNPKSKVAISTCNGLSGMVYDGNDTYFIHPNDIGALHESHYIFSQSDLNETNPMMKNSIFTDPIVMKETTQKKFKRSVTETTTVREPYNANRQSSFVELVIVVDNDVFKKMDENLDKVHNYCKDIANIINSLYVPLNIFIALVGVVVWTEKNEIELSNDGDKTLKNFLNYRRKTLIKDHPNDNAQLLTQVQFDGGVVGKALKGPICTFEFSGGVSTYHSAIVSVVATTIAHEMGHNFGMEHDTPDCKCPDDRCIMSASSSSIAPTHWSECSIHQLNLAIHQGMNHCLKNMPKHLFDPPSCGNGFVETGEECDCGLPSVCKNTCCDPYACKLRSNATCAMGKCCDLATCQPQLAGTECRSSLGECDLPEYCDGSNEFCPMDYFKQDAEECEGGKAYCYKGTCKSRDDQCKLLWGPSGKSSEQCYEKNKEGTRHGNCGFNRTGGVFNACAKENVFCGMLQCRHLNERLEFGLESVAVLSHSFITYGGNVIACRTAVIDLGIETVDPGLAPDGSKCDSGKMCVNQKCIAINTLRNEGKVKTCENDCNKHGVCDNMGHCHCDKGFAPPFCDSPGPGGSIHSGPATNPYDGYGFVRVMYVFFLGVVPFIALSLFLFYYWRQNRPWFITQASANDLKVSVHHYPDRPAPPPPPPNAPSSNQLSPSSTDDMSATLLKANEANEDPIKRELFGNFKGFSLKPLPMSKPNIVGASNVAYVHPVAKAETTSEQCIPMRAAPLPPSNSPKKSQIKSSPISNPKSSPSSFRYQNLNTSTNKTPETPIEVRLFAKERPKISHPVLENSTCSVKELIATANANQNSQKNFNTLPKNNHVEQKIAQKPSDSQTTLKRALIDKNIVKKLDISAPVKAVTFGRSQSMRSPSSEKSPVKRNVLASGSMRHPSGIKRLNSVDRPKNPPPPRPANLPNSATSSLRNIYSNLNDDVGTQSIDNSTDNIYCVIEDVKEPSPPPTNGLLNEIVNEIGNRNKNSIYSTTKKNTAPKNVGNQRTTYENINQSLRTNTSRLVDDKEMVPGSNNIYMNTASVVEQPHVQKSNNVTNPIENAHKPNVNSIVKKISYNSMHPGTAKSFPAVKPAIATKPSIAEQKKSTSKETSQSSMPKVAGSNVTKMANSGKATINPTSNVRAMHKRFENRKT
ncbi:disintegrin and metalloproteinase domain-containing protein 19 [Contarinia nasturtii]|uniref:disintegrin and metalloproteinase domain-containing protein 19 n=1 Tax=Contarinia nasturtii TaxID=265458 RepID=UPI0012D46435|nr:disintegrin and metalloproteinase domain-containing protein 19 [Contarinia nasturtii]